MPLFLLNLQLNPIKNMCVVTRFMNRVNNSKRRDVQVTSELTRAMTSGKTVVSEGRIKELAEEARDKKRFYTDIMLIHNRYNFKF